MAPTTTTRPRAAKTKTASSSRSRTKAPMTAQQIVEQIVSKLQTTHRLEVSKSVVRAMIAEYGGIVADELKAGRTTNVLNLFTLSIAGGELRLTKPRPSIAAMIGTTKPTTRAKTTSRSKTLTKRTTAARRARR